MIEALLLPVNPAVSVPVRGMRDLYILDVVIIPRNKEVSVPVRGMRDLYQVSTAIKTALSCFRPRQGNEGFVFFIHIKAILGLN